MTRNEGDNTSRDATNLQNYEKNMIYKQLQRDSH